MWRKLDVKQRWLKMARQRKKKREDDAFFKINGRQNRATTSRLPDGRKDVPLQDLTRVEIIPLKTV